MSHVHGKKILFLASIAALTSLGVDMCLPAVPAIDADLANGAAFGVLASSLFMAGFAVTPLIGGPLSDSLGRTRVMLIALGGFALAALGCAAAHSIFLFLLFRFMQGCASGMATTLPLAVVGDLLAGSAARRMLSEIATLSSFMPVIAPAMGNLAIHLGGWRFLFAAQALFALVVALSALRFPETLLRSARQTFRLGAILRNCRFLLAQPVLRVHALVYGLLFASTFCFTAVSPLILIERMGMPRHRYAIVFAVNALGSILGNASSAWLNSRCVSAPRIISSGLVIATLSAGSAAALQWSRFASPVELLPAAFLALFGFNLAGPSILLEALRPVPQLLGSGSGLLRFVFMLMNFATSALLGVFCARYPRHVEAATAHSMAGLAAAALLLYLWSSHAGRQGQSPNPGH